MFGSVAKEWRDLPGLLLLYGDSRMSTLVGGYGGMGRMRRMFGSGGV